MSAPIPLSSVLTAGTPYEWHEAVALVAQLIDQARKDTQAQKDGQIPDVSGITLHADGTLSLVLREGHTLPMMPGAVQLLQQLLSGREQPTPLWLFMTQTATATPMPSIDDFAQELNRWERPNRPARLAALHSRAAAGAGTSEPKNAPGAPRVPTTEARAAAGQKRKVPQKKDGRGAPVIVALVAGIIASAAAWFVMGRPLLWSGRRPAVSGVADTIRDAPAATSSPSTPPGTSVPPSAAKAGSRPAGPRRTARATAVAPAIAAASEELDRARLLFDQQQYAEATAHFSRVLEMLGQDDSPQARELRQIATQLAELSRAAVAEAAAAVALEYRAGDPDVVEPVPLSILPAPPRPGADPSSIEVLELHIDQSGNVASARFVMGEPRFRNRWMVSAAKTWRFRPATRNGEPVRFVKRIVLDDGAQPR